MVIEKEYKVCLFLCITLYLCIISSFGQTVNDLIPTVTMKEYVDMQSDLNSKMMQKIVDIQIENINNNVVKANVAMEKRLDSINEFRGQLKDQSATFVTRAELILAVTTLLGLFWGYSKHIREKKESEGKSIGSVIRSGDNVEVKK